jgi:hypothetical protein
LAQFSTQIVGLKETMQILNDFAPQVLKRLRRDMRTEIRPLVRAIQENIPATPPLSGMGKPGRLSWYERNPKSVGVETRLKMSSRRRNEPVELLVLTINSAGAALADNAGARGDIHARAATPTFSRNLQRKGVGVNRLRGAAQRFGWPTAMRNKAMVDRAIINIVEKVEKETNLKFRVGQRKTGFPE